jgi:hypothetical protein
VVYEHATHRLRGYGEELSATLPTRFVLAVEAQPRFVHERRCLKRVALAFPTQHTPRLTAELRVHERDKLLARARLACAPRAQQIRDRVSLLAIRDDAARGGRGLVWQRSDVHGYSGIGTKIGLRSWTPPAMSGLNGVLRAKG